jgi:uncharacterized protein (DUF924 family)
MPTPDDVLAYWFPPAVADEAAAMSQARRWFSGGEDFDRDISTRFGSTIEAALAGELDGWAATARGRLALVVVLDQFTRNHFRSDARTYEGDAAAQRLALEAFDGGLDADLSWIERVFLAMPLLHAEDPVLHDRLQEISARIEPLCPPLWRRMSEMSAEQRKKYAEIIGRFGRFPHRNALLGRTSTAEEVEFLRTWGERAAPKGMRSSS